MQADPAQPVTLPSSRGGGMPPGIVTSTGRASDMDQTGQREKDRHRLLRRSGWIRGSHESAEESPFFLSFQSSACRRAAPGRSSAFRVDARVFRIPDADRRSHRAPEQRESSDGSVRILGVGWQASKVEFFARWSTSSAWPTASGRLPHERLDAAEENCRPGRTARSTSRSLLAAPSPSQRPTWSLSIPPSIFLSAEYTDRRRKRRRRFLRRFQDAGSGCVRGVARRLASRGARTRFFDGRIHHHDPRDAGDEGNRDDRRGPAIRALATLPCRRTTPPSRRRLRKKSGCTRRATEHDETPASADRSLLAERQIPRDGFRRHRPRNREPAGPPGHTLPNRDLSERRVADRVFGGQ